MIFSGSTLPCGLQSLMRGGCLLGRVNKEPPVSA
jgi:hypothetical protein